LRRGLGLVPGELVSLPQIWRLDLFP
jgi:hypothetical protein